MIYSLQMLGSDYNDITKLHVSKFSISESK